jgi:hypothetical protein
LCAALDRRASLLPHVWRIGMNGTRTWGLAALGALLVLSTPFERAQALSLSNPAAAAAVQGDAKMTTEVHWHYHHHWHRHHWHRWHHKHHW